MLCRVYYYSIILEIPFSKLYSLSRGNTYTEGKDLNIVKPAAAASNESSEPDWEVDGASALAYCARYGGGGGESSFDPQNRDL